MTDLDDELLKGVQTLNLNLSNVVIKKLIAFVKLLIKWNKAYNLTAITHPNDIIVRHILDSLSIVPYIKGSPILDVGSGAGLPGIPCALALPTQQFVLLDSNGKKTRFITQAVGELAIQNVTVVQSRVEKYRPPKCFDTILARAFSSLDTIISQTAQLICPEGELLLMKGAYPQSELSQLQQSVDVIRLNVPGLDEQRHLVCIKGRPHG